MLNLKKQQNANELIYKTETDSQTQNLLSQEGKDEGKSGRDRLGIWDGHTSIFKTDNQQGPTCLAQGTVFSIMQQPKWENNLKKNIF